MRLQFTPEISLLVLITAIAASASALAAYPPENAAVLYYQTCLAYQKPSDAVTENMTAMIQEGAAPTTETIEFLKAQARTIKTMTIAANIPNCDWGHNLAEGFEMLLPALADIRNMARIVLADGAAAGLRGDHKTTLDRCLTVYKMAAHLKTNLLIEQLVALAIESMAQSTARQILAAPVDAATLESFRNRLAEITNKDSSILQCMQSEIDVVTNTPIDKLIENLQQSTDAGQPQPKPELDPKIAQASIAYYKEHMHKHMNAMKLPYPQAVAEIEKLNKQMQTDAADKPEARLSMAVVPAISGVISQHTGGRTKLNALQAAVELCIIKAKTGSLPAVLPANLPIDMFSGQPFDYQLTNDGFILRCRTKNAKSDKIEEYAFTVAR
jgi:hypothetical protein